MTMDERDALITLTRRCEAAEAKVAALERLLTCTRGNCGVVFTGWADLETPLLCKFMSGDAARHARKVIETTLEAMP